MQKENEKQSIKKPGQPDQQQQIDKQAADKKVTGQQHTGNNDGAPVHPMKNMPNKDQQQDKNQQGNKNVGKTNPDAEENMGSGKRQDDN